MGQTIRKGIEILAAILVFVGVVQGLNYLYVADDDWCRLVWHDYYENCAKINNLYLGSSHVFCDINPQVLDELNGGYNFNLATPGQLMDGTYYLLREADRDNELSYVYLEMYYSCNVNDKRIETEQFRNWQNLDYMELSFNKILYMLSIGITDNWVECFFPFTRYREELGNWKYVKQIMENKRKDDYLSYQITDYGGERWSYLPQGFRTSKRVYTEPKRCYRQEEILSGHCMGDKSKKYCRKIIEYCQRKDIPITLFISPMNDLQLISTEGYDNYIIEVREIAQEYGIPFYDFNLTKGRYLSFQQDQYFRDEGHLNSCGAAVFTPFFYEVVSREEVENDKYFYASYADKLKETVPTIYGIYYSDSEESGQTRIVWIASNRDSEMEYKIMLNPNDEEPYIVQNFDVNKEFTVSQDEHGICTITARMKGSSEEIQKMEINY